MKAPTHKNGLTPTAWATILALAVSACGSPENQASEAMAAENGVTLVDNGGDYLTEVGEAEPQISNSAIVARGHSDSIAQTAPIPAARSVALPPEWPGAEIRGKLTGHKITDGVHWDMKFDRGGILISTESGSVRKGHWKVTGNELCLDTGFGFGCGIVRGGQGDFQLWKNGVIDMQARLE